MISHNFRLLQLQLHGIQLTSTNEQICLNLLGCCLHNFMDSKRRVDLVQKGDDNRIFIFVIKYCLINVSRVA